MVYSGMSSRLTGSGLILLGLAAAALCSERLCIFGLRGVMYILKIFLLHSLLCLLVS